MKKITFVFFLLFFLLSFSSLTSGATEIHIVRAPVIEFNIKYADMNGHLKITKGGLVILDDLSISFSNCTFYSDPIYNVSLVNYLGNEGEFEILSTGNENFLEKLNHNESYSFGKVVLKASDNCCSNNKAFLSIVITNSDNQKLGYDIDLNYIIGKEDVEEMITILAPDVRYLDKDSFLAKIRILMRIKRERYEVLLGNNITPPDINISYGDNWLLFPFNPNLPGYDIEMEIRYDGNRNLYPFDNYISILHVPNFYLIKNETKIDLHEDGFENYIEFDGSLITIKKVRSVFLTYLIGLSVLIVFTFCLIKHFKAPRTKLKSPQKQLFIILGIVAILSFSLLLSFRSLDTIYSVGIIPFGLILILIIISYFYYLYRRNG